MGGEQDDRPEKGKKQEQPVPENLNILSIMGFQRTGAPSAQSLDPPIGTATMSADGTITLHLKGHGQGGVEGEAQLTYRKSDKDYNDVIQHLEGLTPGQSKLVRPWDPREKGGGEKIPPFRRGDVTPDAPPDLPDPVAPPDFTKTVQDTYDKLPDGVKKKIEDAGYKLAPVAKMTDALPELKGQKPRGWPPGSTWDDCDGCLSVGKKLIVVAANHRSHDKWVANSSPDGVARHEIGHATDYSLSNYSDTQEFKDAYDKDVAKIPQDKRDKLEYFLQSGEAGHEETFAECFAVLNGGASYPGYTKDIETYFPETMAVVKQKMASLPARAPAKAGP